MTARSLELVFFDAGGGHRAAADALQTVLAKSHPDWRVEIVDLQEALKSADPLFILTGTLSQDLYNAALKLGLTYGSRAFLRGLQAAIRLCAPRMEERLRERWSKESAGKGAPDLVVSLVPNFNGIMYRALAAASPGTPFVTIMTDMADQPPRFWQEKQDQYLICGTAFAARQARETGWYRPERIFQTSGMIIRPSFYDLPKKPRVTRASLGLAEGVPTALIMFGGYGSSAAADIVERFAAARLKVQSIVMCGHNDALREALHKVPGCHAAGFTRDVADYMRIANFFIGKPGPGSLSEAWHMDLPTIVEGNARTMIQERPNVALAEALGAGIAVKSFRRIARIVGAMIDSGQLTQMRAQLRRMNNRAVFEIPAMLEKIMASPRSPARSLIGLTPPRKLTRIAQKLGRREKTRGPSATH
jgi:UDP-N-acetylglucosamine:LPS N-acetylglucosamine transferase